MEVPGQVVQPVVVKGTPLTKGGKNKLTGGKTTYQFSNTITGPRSAPATTPVATLPLGPGYKPVGQAWLTKTTVKHTALTTPRVRKVRMSVDAVKVVKDGDTGIRGRARFASECGWRQMPILRWRATGARGHTTGTTTRRPATATRSSSARPCPRDHNDEVIGIR